ncbi:MAG: hypothetical protein Q9169_000573 [Polycauliona sp. 2 TL-2023]
MATHLTRPQPPQPSLLPAPNSPPKRYLHNVTQPQRPVRDPADSRAQQPVTESGPIGTLDYGNTNLLVPKAPHALTSNGEPSRRSTMSMNGLPFHSARSPPNAKNTSHVPCKFFRLGQCQAGKACPFSHSTEVSSVDTPCKYFAKGNCKFGSKCALAHILPNGRRVNRPNNVNGGLLNLGGRVDPQTYHPDSALANSLLAQQTNGDAPSFGLHFSHAPGGEYIPRPHLASNGAEGSVPTETFTTNPELRYGSPRDDGRAPISPGGHLSTLDAPMPASFDSQGISYIARHGPVAASVPSKFGLESPSSSLPKKAALPSSTLRNLHNSAFGGDPRNSASNLGSSPLGSGDEGYGRRIMHSELVTRPTAISASVPRARMGDDWDDGIIFGGEEDFLPTSLHDLLTPQERLRRLSRSEQDERPFRDSLSGPSTPADSSSHVGSPSHASPSRFSAFFAKQRRDEQSNGSSSTSVFGHVGSPLRNSSMPVGRSSSLRATSNPARSGDVSPYLSSPPRQSSMSMISQQLARTQISSKTDSGLTDSNSSNSLHPNSARTANQAGSSTSRLDRATSSSNINNERIEEEQGDGVFSMEEEEDIHRKRHGENGWSSAPNPEQQQDGRQSLGPIGTGRTFRAREVEKVSKEYWT